jgi:tetratricopeptide (TPR) repeat protein
MNKLFKKKEIFKVKSKPVDPASIGEPNTADEYQRRGMAYYARKQFEPAEIDLQKATQLDPNHIDSYYSLGMVMKAVGRKDDAVSAFKKVISLIANNQDLEKVKFEMLKRLAMGHVNEITQGDWNLEKEIWKHTN